MALSKPMEVLAFASAAAGAGFCAEAVSFPVDTIKVRMQASRDTDVGVLSEIRKLIKEKGFSGFFEGVGPKLIWSMYGKGVYYGSYEMFRTIYASNVGPVTALPNFVCGYLADFAHIPISMPFETIATRMQNCKNGESLTDIVSGIFKTAGIGGFYRGFKAHFVLCFKAALFNTIFTQVKISVLKSRGLKATASLGALESFMLGAFARGLATCVFFPYIRAKVQVQAGATNELDGSPKGVFQVIREIVKEDGFLNLYTGIGPELVRGVMSSAITLMMKERLVLITRGWLLERTVRAIPAVQ